MSKRMDDLYTELANTKEEKEPAWRTGAIAGTVTAVLSTVTYFVPISDRTQTLILSISVILAPWIIAYLIRRKVWSPATVNEILQDLESARGTLEQIREDAGRLTPKFNVDKEETYDPPKQPFKDHPNFD